MLLVAFFQWWYGAGWAKTARRLEERLRHTYLEFSVPILLTTLFAPWRRIITVPGASLQDRTRAVLDNMVSRGVGVTMRLFTLVAAGCILAGYGVGGGLLLLMWPVLPFLGPVLIVWGLVP